MKVCPLSFVLCSGPFSCGSRVLCGMVVIRRPAPMVVMYEIYVARSGTKDKGQRTKDKEQKERDLAMRIGIDGCCWSNRRGYGRFTRELLTALAEYDRSNQYVT